MYFNITSFMQGFLIIKEWKIKFKNTRFTIFLDYFFICQLHFFFFIHLLTVKKFFFLNCSYSAYFSKNFCENHRLWIITLMINKLKKRLIIVNIIVFNKITKKIIIDFAKIRCFYKYSRFFCELWSVFFHVTFH